MITVTRRRARDPRRLARADLRAVRPHRRLPVAPGRRRRARARDRGGDRPRPRRLLLGPQRPRGRGASFELRLPAATGGPGRPGAGRGAGSDRSAGAVSSNLLESTSGRALPQVPPADVRRGGRAGGGRADAHERDRAGQDPPGVPVRRPARHRQDLARAHPREGAQLRARARRRHPTTPATRASRSRTARRST